MLTVFREQPRALTMIFMLEVWERFGYYMVQGILTLYFIRILGFDDTRAYHTFGAFFALVYGMIALGGYLGDKILGTKRTLILGLITLALGYLALAFSDVNTVFLALGLVCVGNGLFKANPASLLARCYQDNDPRLHSAFTIYYMGINLGSIFALFLGPALARHQGYTSVYLISFIGLLLGLVNYQFQRRHVAHINNAADLQPVAISTWLLVIIGIVLLTFLSAFLLQHLVFARNLLIIVTLIVSGIYFWCMRQQQKAGFMRMLVAFILMLEGIVFWTLYQQLPTSLNLFAVNNVTPVLAGISLDPQSFQALNAIWIIAMSPVLAFLYRYLNQRGISFPTPYKFAMGMFFCGISFLLLFFARFVHDESGMVSSWWLVASNFFQSTGELLVAAMGVVMIAELVPSTISGFAMGMWFLTPAIAGFVGASVASLSALPQYMPAGIASLHIYTGVFAGIGTVILIIAILLWWIAAPLSRWMLYPST